MSRTLASLNALRYFEAAARHQSFSRAAEELAVTHASVSRQVQSLEAMLAVPLFHRRHKKVTLTSDGEALFEAVRAGLGRIEGAAERIAGRKAARPLVLTLDSILTQKWLLPRFAAFRREHPDIPVTIEARPDITDLPEEADCAVCFFNRTWSKNIHIPMYVNWQFLVASPEYIARHPEIRHPTGLRGKTLVHDRTREFWRLISAHLSVDLPWWEGPLYEDSNVMVEAVAAGEGIGVGDEMTCRPHLESGLIEPPFQMFLTSRFVYFFSYRPALAEDPRVLALRDWVLDQAAEQRAWFDAFWATQRRINPGWVAGSAVPADESRM